MRYIYPNHEINDMDRFMRLAFELAQKADPFPNPKVGAVLVAGCSKQETGNPILGIGYHVAAGQPHAEIIAIQDAIHKTQKPDVCRGATLYVTLEPCSYTAKRTPPCTKKILEVGIKRVVFAMEDPNQLVKGKGARALRDAGIEVVGPTDEAEAKTLNLRYLGQIAEKPFVAIKMAMSLDGKTATRTGDSKWISCEESRDFVYQLRSEFDAVMVGAGTIKTDDPELTTHGRNGRGSDPYRIIIDGGLSTPTTANVVKNNDRKTIIVASERMRDSKNEKIKNKKTTTTKIASLERAGVRVLFCGKGKIDLKQLLLALGAMGIKKILIEGGGELNAGALEAGIVNKFYLFVAPKIIGGKDAKPVVGGLGIAKMTNALQLKNLRTRQIGTDVLIEAEI